METIIVRSLALGAVFAVALAVPAPAQAPTLALLDDLQRGSWEIRPLGTERVSERICVRNPAVLLQLRHRGARCQRFTVEDTPSRITVQYTCPGRGNGRTVLRKESNALVQIQTQGIAGDAPFDLAVEARHASACGG